MLIRQLWVMLKQKNWKGKFIWNCFSSKPTYRGSLLSSFYCFWISELYPFHLCLDLIHQESRSLPRVTIYLNMRYWSILHMGCRILNENQIQLHTESMNSCMRTKAVLIFFFFLYFGCTYTMWVLSSLTRESHFNLQDAFWIQILTTLSPHLKERKKMRQNPLTFISVFISLVWKEPGVWVVFYLPWHCSHIWN